MKPGKKGIARIIDATGYSFTGLSHVWKNEAAFRQEVMFAVLFIGFGFWLGETVTQYILMVCSCLLVLIVEVLNSAIEAVVDRIGSEIHELSGRAKDMGSFAVFISLMNVLLVYGLIIYDNFFS